MPRRSEGSPCSRIGVTTRSAPRPATRTIAGPAASRIRRLPSASKVAPAGLPTPSAPRRARSIRRSPDVPSIGRLTRLSPSNIAATPDRGSKANVCRCPVGSANEPRTSCPGVIIRTRVSSPVAPATSRAPEAGSYAMPRGAGSPYSLVEVVRTSVAACGRSNRGAVSPGAATRTSASMLASRAPTRTRTVARRCRGEATVSVGPLVELCRIMIMPLPPQRIRPP